ncbi:FtsK/SpoIIIE domain-containing protein [Serinibacter arcticus]|uniref:FtsK/SpoIIIE domain-containing protein n=1 Tax=Serinibacter arcticus TaxID=1655435 RepID=UPI001304EB96|nr:FtsK/SpoIIIE domain-containing protein [Serinibacter arcticus]
MWRLSVVPSTESALDPVDVVVESAPHGRVADLAATLGEHLAGAGSRVLLAPVSDGRPWPAQQRLADSPLRDGGLLHVASVPSDWLTRPTRQRRPRALLRVVAGPEAGRTHELHGDVVTLGRGDVDVRLADPLVSRTHARLILGATPAVVDLGSAHGTRLGDREVVGAQPLAWGERLRLGSTEIVLEPAEGTRTPDAEQGVLRPPRFGSSVEATELDVPSPPASPRKSPFPWPMMLMPVMIGGGMLAMSRSPMSLIFMIGFPLMMAMTNLVQRRQARKEFEAERDLWREDVRGVLTGVDEAAQTQRTNALEDEPDLEAVVVRARTRDHRLWARQQEDDDFLTVRSGLGPRPALVTAKAPTGGDRGLRSEVGRALATRTELADLPVPLELTAGLTAVTGPAETVDAWVRAAVVRLAVTHSPTDLAVTAVLGPGRASLESWLRWLPHVSSAGPAPVAVGAAAGQALLESLTLAAGGAQHTLCLVDEGAGLTRRHVEAVAQAAGERQLHLLWLGARREEVPAATARVVDLATSSLEHARRGGTDAITELEALDLATAWSTARSLAGYRDEAAVGAAEALLPPAVRLPELTGCGSDDVEQVLERWSTSRGLRAQLGAGTDGAVTIDLREDGPHGLVAGTTGAGKSELLQSLIASLAVNNPPSRITFLLVDYKGGAAFRECAQLPHTVGYITDLTPALVQRALVSLHAELTTREHLLERYGAKDLVDLERSHPEAAPPSMLICVDEFAALLAEVPDFVDGMVSIAQRGRSLGMHMLLATQRPAGVVTPRSRPTPTCASRSGWPRPTTPPTSSTRPTPRSSRAATPAAPGCGAPATAPASSSRSPTSGRARSAARRPHPSRCVRSTRAAGPRPSRPRPTTPASTPAPTSNASSTR